MEGFDEVDDTIYFSNYYNVYLVIYFMNSIFEYAY